MGGVGNDPFFVLPGAEAFKRDMIISLRRRAGARFGEAEEIADVMACVVSLRRGG